MFRESVDKGLALQALIACALATICAQPAAAQARVLHVSSKILGEDRTIHVNLPPNYAVARQRYQVTYLLDGHVKAFFDLAVASAGYDLIGDMHDYRIPPQIVVGIEQKDRGSDLGRNQDAFDRFLSEELVPYVDREFRTNTYRTLIGHSLGGRFALQTFCRNPGMFAAVIAISPGISDSTGIRATTDCLKREFSANTSVVRQLVLIAGDREARLMTGLARLREFLRDSAPSNWRLTALDGTGLGHTDTPYAAIPLGIRLIHDRNVWEMPVAQMDSILQGTADPDGAIAAWYRGLSARMGYTVAPSAKWLNAAVTAYVRRGNVPAAEAAARRAIAVYPEDLTGYAVLADLYIARNDAPAARRTLNDALRVLDRLEFFDETERALKRAVFRASLEKLPP
jgi:enterochelin esterase-like enzyme